MVQPAIVRSSWSRVALATICVLCVTILYSHRRSGADTASLSQLNKSRSRCNGFRRPEDARQPESLFQRQWQRAILYAEDLKQRELDEADVWDVYSPFFSCPLMERVGKVLDGGKWVCARDYLLNHDKCVVYSLGSRGDVSFEKAILANAPQCKVHTYDFTLQPKQIKAVTAVPGVQFHDEGICSDAQLEEHNRGEFTFTSIKQSMAANDVEWIDILKIDIEGYEWPVFAELLESEEDIPFTQIQVELHLLEGNFAKHRPYMPEAWRTRNGALHRLMTRMVHHGFRPFSAEPNQHSRVAAYCTEYSFIRVESESGLFKCGP